MNNNCRQLQLQRQTQRMINGKAAAAIAIATRSWQLATGNWQLAPTWCGVLRFSVSEDRQTVAMYSRQQIGLFSKCIRFLVPLCGPSNSGSLNGVVVRAFDVARASSSPLTSCPETPESPLRIIIIVIIRSRSSIPIPIPMPISISIRTTIRITSSISASSLLLSPSYIMHNCWSHVRRAGQQQLRRRWQHKQS